MASCRDCKFFIHDPAGLERALPGLAILSSAYGAARGATGLCERRDLFLTPAPACPQFQPERLEAHAQGVLGLTEKTGPR